MDAKRARFKRAIARYILLPIQLISLPIMADSLCILVKPLAFFSYLLYFTWKPRFCPYSMFKFSLLSSRISRGRKLAPSTSIYPSWAVPAAAFFNEADAEQGSHPYKQLHLCKPAFTYPQSHGCHSSNRNVEILPWLLSQRNKTTHWNTMIPVCDLLKYAHNGHWVKDLSAKALIRFYI